MRLLGVGREGINIFCSMMDICHGITIILKILSSMGITIGPESHAFVNKRDQVRINRSEVRATEASKKARTAKSSERASLNMIFKVEEGTLYGAGIAD
ncbi:Protein of unknown function [Cotesia congregata]|uniref:Uncharacterized protein n=1 Tax=Cotesia congregata TaxID=51543 RepID=A0A8J2HQH0_COTCN|nr:Protein of unknown function [Cotesia congregata]